MRIYLIVHTWYDSLFSSHTQQKEFQSRCNSLFNPPRINARMVIWRMVQRSSGELDRASLCDAEVEVQWVLDEQTWQIFEVRRDRSEIRHERSTRETKDFGIGWPQWHALMFYEKTVVDMMKLCPQDVKKLFIQRAREGAVEELGGHECKELKAHLLVVSAQEIFFFAASKLCWALLDVTGTRQLLFSSHLRDWDKMLLRSILSHVVPLAPYFVCLPHQTPGGSGVLVQLAPIVAHLLVG